MRHILLGFVALLPASAMAQGAGTPDLAFTLGAGVEARPGYFGSDEYELGPDFSFRLNYLDLGRRTIGSLDPTGPEGFGVRGSFRYIPERDDGEFGELEGLDDVDAAVELGLGVGYEAQNFAVFGDLRYGVVGHESVVGEVGADVIARPMGGLELSLGPRVFLGSDDYAETYYGISSPEATVSDFDAFAADGGVLSTGVELGASYEINDTYSLEGAVTYRRLQGDAGDSPIVQQGDRDQYSAHIGITRRFTLGF